MVNSFFIIENLLDTELLASFPLKILDNELSNKYTESSI